MKIEYTKVGDYYLPNLYYPEETRPIGFWGILRKKYLKEHKSGTYTYLLLTTRLDSYLADMNEQAQERFELKMCIRDRPTTATIQGNTGREILKSSGSMTA